MILDSSAWGPQGVPEQFPKIRTIPDLSQDRGRFFFG